MSEFAILTNRKRAIVALIHSDRFLLIAFRQMVAATPAAGIWVPSSVSTGTWILCGDFHHRIRRFFSGCLPFRAAG